MRVNSSVKAQQMAQYYETTVKRLEKRLLRQDLSGSETTRKQIEGCFERIMLLRRLAHDWED